MEIGNGVQEFLLLLPLREVGGESVEVLQMTIEVTVLDRERLFAAVIGEGVLRLQRGGGGHVHQQIFDG